MKRLASILWRFGTGAFVASLVALFPAGKVAAATIWLDQLDLSNTVQDWGQARRAKSVEGHSLRIGGEKFTHGLGTHARSTLYVMMDGAMQTFSAAVGVDSEISSTNATVTFSVLGDGKLLWESGMMHAGQPPENCSVNLQGVKILALKVGDADKGISYDHADWADAKFEFSGAPPETVIAPPEEAVRLTPPDPGGSRINGAAIFGVRPGHPFQFQIAATGNRPMEFSADGLPAGLHLDGRSGLISGTAPASPGRFEVTLRAKNPLGAADKKFEIVVGEDLALSPPMGWNSWNCFANNVDDGMIRAMADAMVASGLVNHGWTYINIDDSWEGQRDGKGMIQPNARFPDMKALADYVHARGLKIGIYSSPGPKTCAGFEASWQHEWQDAAQYAAWGIDYLKYDWCSYDSVEDKTLPDPQGLIRPYSLMNDALRRADRDIVFSLCQYGMGDVWEWGAQAGGNCWRISGDITDTWGSMASNGFGSAGHEKFAGPGHWNDPDMLVVGKIGWGKLRATRLTPNEQYTHVSLWCLLSAPLLIGADLSKLDDFTLNLLSNDEVLAVDQDPLGRQASRIWRDGDLEIWAKDMEDGSKAVGLFNRGELSADMQLNWSQLGITGRHRVRDLWRQQDLGGYLDVFSARVPRHGVVLVRVW